MATIYGVLSAVLRCVSVYRHVMQTEPKYLLSVCESYTSWFLTITVNERTRKNLANEVQFLGWFQLWELAWW